MELNAGKLDRRIDILRAVKSKDAYNADVTSWVPHASVFAEAQPVSDGERMRAGEVLGSKMYRFRIRYSSLTKSIDNRDRVRFDGRIYDINGVKEIGRKVGIEITATARAQTP